MSRSFVDIVRARKIINVLLINGSKKLLLLGFTAFDSIFFGSAIGRVAFPVYANQGSIKHCAVFFDDFFPPFFEFFVETIELLCHPAEI